MSLEIPLTVVYKEINGSRITTDLYLPTHSPEQKHPVGALSQTQQLESTFTRLTDPVINIHGGAFMLGHSRMVSLPQVEDCLGRGWIVVVPNHRLCPGVNILEGPMQDIRDLLTWIQDGQLDSILSTHGYRADLDNIAAFGTSSGGHLALSLVSTHLNIPTNLVNKPRASMFPNPSRQFSPFTALYTSLTRPGEPHSPTWRRSFPRICQRNS